MTQKWILSVLLTNKTFIFVFCLISIKIYEF